MERMLVWGRGALGIRRLASAGVRTATGSLLRGVIAAGRRSYHGVDALGLYVGEGRSSVRELLS